jgi:hypothetical protein
MRITRRAWGATLAAALARPQSAVSQASEKPTPQQDFEQSRKDSLSNYEAMAKMKLPRSTEPSFKFTA